MKTFMVKNVRGCRYWKAGSPSWLLTIGDAKTMDDMADLVAEARGKKYFDKFRSQIGTFTDREQKLMDERKANAVKTSSNSMYMIIGGVALAIVLALLVSLFLANSVAKSFRAIFQGLKTFSTGELGSVRIIPLCLPPSVSLAYSL